MGKQIYIDPFKRINIFSNTDSMSLQEILDNCATCGIDPKNYGSVMIGAEDEYNLYCVANIAKTQQEIDEEIKKKEEDQVKRKLAEAKGRENRIKRQIEKAQKEQQRHEVLKTLTPEQREALGL